MATSFLKFMVLLGFLWEHGQSASVQDQFQDENLSPMTPNPVAASANFTETSAKERFFALVRFHPEACDISPTAVGTCTTSTDCMNRGGSNIGTCAKGLGVCCQLTLSCNTQTSFVNVRDKAVILEPLAGATVCTYEFPRLEGSCQIMADFLEFTLQPPNPVTGACAAEFMKATGSVTVPRDITICGMNTGQRIYLSYGRLERVTLEFNTPMNGRYRIRARHIQCNAMNLPNSQNTPVLAPNQCLQYYTTSTGIVRSFSYGNGVIAGQYTVCIQDLGSSRTIEWRECEVGTDVGAIAARSQFFLSNWFIANPLVAVVPPAPVPPDRFGVTGPYCDGNSFVEVFGERRHCGARFTVELANGGQIPVSSEARPFQLFVNIGRNEYVRPPWLPTTAMVPTPSFPYPIAAATPAVKQCAMMGTPATSWQAFSAMCAEPIATNGWLCTCTMNAAPVFLDNQPNRTGFCLRYALM